MKVLFACVCDHAIVDQIGKLSVSGIFDRIQAANFPARHQKMYLVSRLLFEHEDNNLQHRVSIALLDADNQALLQAEFQLEHSRILPGEFATMNQIIEMNDLVIMHAGRYKFVLSWSDVDRFEVPMAVVSPSA